MNSLTELSCPNCGATLPLADGADQLQCPHCGTSLVLTAQQRLVVMLPPAAPLACPSCGRDNDPDATFCQFCGAEVLPRCPRCSASNPLEAVFCKRCGVDLNQAKSGFSDDKAGEWTAFFSACGFQPLFAELRENLSRVMRESGDPPLGAHREVEIVWFPIDKATHPPLSASWVEIQYPPGHPISQNDSRRYSDGFLIFTNWRLVMCFLSPDLTWGHRPYKQLIRVHTENDWTTFLTRAGDIIHIQMKPYRESLARGFIREMITSQDETLAGQKRAQAAGRERTSREALAGLERFFEELVQTAHESPDTPSADDDAIADLSQIEHARQITDHPERAIDGRLYVPVPCPGCGRTVTAGAVHCGACGASVKPRLRDE